MKGMIAVVCVLCLWAQLSAAAWTSWLDRDNQSGQGDFETLSDFNPHPCGGAVPLQVEGRVKGSSTTAFSATQRITFGGQYGLSCVNAQNGGSNSCMNYKIQFVDPGVSPLLNRDWQTGKGDYELRSLFTSTYTGNKVRWNMGSNDYGESAQRLTMGPTVGLYCRNSENTGYCLDYEVRFLCP